MSKDCSFDSHISSLSRKCKNLAGWILRSFVSRNKLTMLTLFKSLVISRLDYASQLWSPHKISQITLIEKVQRSFTKHITGMRDLSYHERLQALRLYSLQRRRERYCINLIWKIIESKAQNLSDPILCNFSDRRGRLLRVTSEYHLFHYMILRDYIHSSLSSEFFSFGAHIMKLVSLL